MSLLGKKRDPPVPGDSFSRRPQGCHSIPDLTESYRHVNAWSNQIVSFSVKHDDHQTTIFWNAWRRTLPCPQKECATTVNCKLQVLWTESWPVYSGLTNTRHRQCTCRVSGLSVWTRLGYQFVTFHRHQTQVRHPHPKELYASLVCNLPRASPRWPDPGSWGGQRASLALASDPLLFLLDSFNALATEKGKFHSVKMSLKCAAFDADVLFKGQKPRIPEPGKAHCILSINPKIQTISSAKSETRIR